MAAKTIIERVKAVKYIEKVNELALNDLNNLKLFFEEANPSKILDTYLSLVSHVYDMARGYQNISNKGLCLSYLEALQKIEMQTGNKLEAFCKILRFGKKSVFDFEANIERINYIENNHGYDSIEKCLTLHDLVRCLHASTINALFSSFGLEEKPEVLTFNSDTFEIIRADNGSNNQIIDAILKPYHDNVSKRGYEQYKIISLEGLLSAKVNMGCHFCSLDISSEKNEADLKLKFVNTPVEKYCNANNRARYVREIMERLNLNVNQNGTLIEGRKFYLDSSDLTKDIEICVRMLASTRDLDLPECKINGRVDEAIAAFFKGKSNIYRFLNKGED